MIPYKTISNHYFSHNFLKFENAIESEIESIDTESYSCKCDIQLFLTIKFLSLTIDVILEVRHCLI